MKRQKLIAYGALFAIILMVGSGVLVGLSPLFTEKETGEREVSLNVYKNNSLDLKINGVKDGLAYLPQGVVYVQYSKDTENASGVFLNTTNVTSMLMAQMYFMTPAENGSYTVSQENLVMYNLEDPEAAKTVINSTAQYYSGYALLRRTDGSFMIPGTPTIVGTSYAVSNTLSIIGNTTSPAATFNTIASHIPSSYEADYEYLMMTDTSAGFDQYYEGGAALENGTYMSAILFLNAENALKERLIYAMETKAIASIVYEYDDSEDGTFSIMIRAPDIVTSNVAATAISSVLEKYAAEKKASETPSPTPSA